MDDGKLHPTECRKTIIFIDAWFIESIRIFLEAVSQQTFLFTITEHSNWIETFLRNNISINPNIIWNPCIMVVIRLYKISTFGLPETTTFAFSNMEGGGGGITYW
jgi:hypothetical protein